MKKSTYTFLSLFVLLFSFVSFFSVETGLCSGGDPSCINFFSLTATQTLFFGIALLLVSPVFKKWNRFFVFYIPLALLIFVFYNPHPQDFTLPSKELVALAVSAIYVVVSYLLVWREK